MGMKLVMEEKYTQIFGRNDRVIVNNGETNWDENSDDEIVESHDRFVCDLMTFSIII